MSTPAPTIPELGQRLGGLMLADEARLGRELERLRGNRRQRDGEAQLGRLAARIDRAEALVSRRQAALPVITYPAGLPISQRRDDIAAAIAANQLVVIAGETGSGKTTQLPKICLELGRGVRGTIGHTQPRRLAARTVAERIAEELSVPLGGAVGYAVRFTDQVSETTLVKLMTDGILLAEIQRDPMLWRYDTLIIDEAHERSLTIDFILGYLAQLLPRRPDLKVIVTSATIDPGRFSAHFGGAPIVEVSGRTYPVEVRYRPLDPALLESSDDDPDGLNDVVRGEVRDQTEGVIDAVRELSGESHGDILVFLSGEREIRDTAEALRALDLPATEILPLYARLSTAEQHKVFAPHAGRRVVLATNVAETSLTVPGIRYVVDPGTARISRYSHRTKVQRLPIEAISQASANQRAGRCGRTSDGICIRLYSEADYVSRPLFTEPEILRTNLAAVILQMTALGLGDMDKFPFLDPPDRRSVRDGLALLHELGAIDSDSETVRRQLTPIGRKLAALPVDTRLARMIIAADAEGCVREVLIIAAALSIPDPRERPAESRPAADQSHARFADEHSDFISLLNLWNYISEQQVERSGNQFRRMCRDEFLHYLRIREWQDLRGQLRQIAQSLGITEADQPADHARVHAALTAGLLSHIGLRTGETREYQGGRGARFVLAPGSTLSKRPPRWVVAAELVETSRLFARVAARVEPEVVEKLAPHLVLRTYSEPHWDERRGAVMAYERVTLYGLPLVARRRMNYGSIDAEVARDLFIRHALVGGEWETHHKFFQANLDLIDELAELEERTRRRDLIVSDDDRYAFYDARIPADIVSARHFDAWWKQARQKTPGLLTMTRADLLGENEPAGLGDDHPDVWHEGDLALPVTYVFSPGAPDDGVTVHVPVDVLTRLGGAKFGWQVPALREEMVTALIRSLPKVWRRNFVPVPDTVRAVLANLGPDSGPLLEGLQRELYERSGVLVPLDAFALDQVPDHLRVTFAVVDSTGSVVGKGKDLALLQEELSLSAREAVTNAIGAEVERRDLRDWPVDLILIPRIVEKERDGYLVRGHPALVDAGATVELRVFSTEAEQTVAMTRGLRRLLRLTVPTPAKAVESALTTRERLVLGINPDGSLGALIDDCVDAAVDDIMARNGGAPWDRESFVKLREVVRSELPTLTTSILKVVHQAMRSVHEVRASLPDKPPPAYAASVADMRKQLDLLLPKGFVALAGASRVRHLARYLEAVLRRWQRLSHSVEIDIALMARIAEVEKAYQKLVDALSPLRAGGDDIRDIAAMIQELRVSLFAQQLGTAQPISEKRIYRAIDSLSL
jgi:ATP-dependent helicase HrpA